MRFYLYNLFLFQPTRHAPAQTPTNVVRPTAMRTPSTMRTSTSQSDIQLPQMSVQPIISTFVPATVTQTTTVTQEQQRDPALLSDEVPRALVQPRQSSEEPIPGPSFVTSVASPPGKSNAACLARHRSTFFYPLYFSHYLIK